MNTILGFMDKIYSDSKTLSIIYVVGAVLLFIFIVLLIISLRKPDEKKEFKIIEEPDIDKDEEKKVDINNTETVEEKEFKPIDQSIFEKTVIIPLSEIEKNNIKEKTEELESKEEDVVSTPNSGTDNVTENKTIKEEIEPTLTKIEEEQKEMINEEEKVVESTSKLSADIPNIDDFVDNVVKKTYEKNEQFSSVYVEDTNPKLDKVMENLNVDEAVKENILPVEEKTIEEVQDEPIKEELQVEQKEEIVKEPEKENVGLDSLKKALEEKKQEVNLKQDELKAKLEGLKQEKTTTINKDDLLSKLNNKQEK